MGVFDWLKTKQSATTRAIVSLVTGHPIWTPRNYEALAREGYQQNVWVYACVNEIAIAASGVPWVLYQGPRVGRRGKVKEIDTHPLLTLIQRPNPEQGQAAFIEAMVGYYQLSGNSFVEAVGPDRGAPRELYALRPDRMRVVPDYINRVAGYVYEVGPYKQAFEREQILHMKRFNPLNDWYGMSPLEAAARSVDESNASGAYQTALLQNSARPSGALMSEQPLTDQQFKGLKKELEELYQGADNAGRPMLLEGGLKWQAMGLTPTDIGLIEATKWSAAQIAAAFGVPGEIIGLNPATYENRREARKALYTETVLPLMDRIRDDLNNWLTPQFGDRLRLDYDRDEIEALQEDRDKVWSRVKDAHWLTVNEKRELVGYESHPEGDVLLVPTTEQTLEQAIKGTSQADTPAPDPAPQGKAMNLETADAKLEEWKATDDHRRAWERNLETRLRDRFDEERRSVVEQVKSGVLEPALDLDAWERLYTAMYTACAEDFGERTMAGLKRGQAPEVKVFNLFAAAVQAAIRAVVAKQVTQVTDTTKASIRDYIVASLADDEDFGTMAEHLDGLYLEEIIPKRSMVIARTETLTASSLGARYAAKELEGDGAQVTKEWVSTPDHRTRADHREANGQKRGIDEPYSVGGAHMMYPGDPSGGAKNVIQCRCIEIYHTEGES